MVLRHIGLLLSLSYLIRLAIAATVVDDTESSITYSNSGPSWWGANVRNGSGRYVGGQLAAEDKALNFTWHETVGDGAAFTFTFTGTRVSLISTICNSGYNTTINFFIDDEFKSQYRHLVPGPMMIATPRTPHISDIQLRVTVGDFPDLSAARHTFRAVSVGSDTLMVVDAISFEPADVPTTASSISGSTTRSASTAVPSSSNSTLTTSTSTSQSTLPAPTLVAGGSQPVVTYMDVKAADSRIAYSPPGAWKQYSSARRATSCLEGTMISSTAGSSLTYNFTGSALQLYTISAPNGGNYSISVDGVDQGMYSSYDATADPSNCPSKSLFSTTALTNTEHSLVLTVQDHPSGSTQDTIQFVGFRTSSSTVNVNSPNTGPSSPNIGAIVGGVVGGIAGLALLTFLVVWWMRRQRKASEGSEITQFPDPSLHSAFTGDPLTSEARTHTESHPHSQAQWVAESSPPTFVIPQYPQDQPAPNYDYTAAPPTTVPGDEDDGSTDVDRLTYYTLPPYHENVRGRPAARDLSEADVNAISRRLQEVMRSQMEQSGVGRNSLVGVEPPRELIDHLVEQQSSKQPRAV